MEEYNKINNSENKKKNNKRIKGVGKIFVILLIIAITAIITFFLTIKYILGFNNKSKLEYFQTKLGLINSQLKNESIYDLDEDKMYESALKGYVAGIDDKYTQYLTKEEMKELTEETTGNYVGIGVYLANNTSNNTVIVIGVIEDSAAEKAGIQSGDIIEKVDGVEFNGDQLEEASNKVRGEEGTNVKITILRNNEEKEFDVTRSTVKIKSVSSKMIDNNKAYINISSFNDGTSDEFKKAYEDLKKQNPTGLIIDLRNNGGGLVSESLAIAETMTKKDQTLLITTNKNKKEEIRKSTEDPIIDIPVVVLINQNTASASEILAGILKDDCGYKIIGTTSYGKGVIQAVYNFNDGTGLKVTIEEYFTPNHNKINKVGITPDVNVELDDEWKNVSNIPYENDKQLQQAIKELQ